MKIIFKEINREGKDMTASLINMVRAITDLPKAEEEKFVDVLSPVHIQKGDHYISGGQIPKKFGFVVKGLFRYYYIDKQGTEYTKNFVSENNFLTSYSAMINQSPSIMYIEALENSEILELNYSDWNTLKKGHPCWNTLLVSLLERVFMIKEKRERELLFSDAQERYENFKSEYPMLESRIKQHMVASYLGISPVSLSRIKKQILH